MFVKERVTYDKDVQTADFGTETSTTPEEEIREQLLREQREMEEERAAKERELEEESARLEKEIEQEIRG